MFNQKLHILILKALRIALFFFYEYIFLAPSLMNLEWMSLQTKRQILHCNSNPISVSRNHTAQTVTLIGQALTTPNYLESFLLHFVSTIFYKLFAKNLRHCIIFVSFKYFFSEFGTGDTYSRTVSKRIEKSPFSFNLLIY